MIKEFMTMRDFSKLFQTGNLTPKERVLILIADVVSKESKGKGFLSKADISGLQNWTPKDYKEVNEYNKYQSAYKLYLYMELDAKLQYKDAEISEARIAILTKDFNFYEIYTHALARLDEIKPATIQEAIEIYNLQRKEKLKTKNWSTLKEEIDNLTFELLEIENKDDYNYIYMSGEPFNYNPDDYNETERKAIEKAIKKANDIMQGLIKDGTFKIEKNDRGEDYITLESLYNSNLNYDFVKLLKKHIDTYESNWGETKNAKGEVIDDKALLIGGGLGFSGDEIKGFFLKTLKDSVKDFSIIGETGDSGTITFKDKYLKEIYLNHKNNFIRHYQILLTYNEIFKDFSSLFDVDMTYNTKEYIEACKNAITLINDVITGAIGGKDADAKTKKHLKRRIETMTRGLDKDLIIDADKIKPNTEYFKSYYKDLNELFGDKYK
jgi:hypothetical protein